MSNKSVLGSPDYHFNGPKTTFPLSRDFTFTAAPGMLLPVMRKFLSIGEKVKVNPSFFLRTDPLLAPSMTDIDVYVENYFVPMRHLLAMFEDWFTQVDDIHSDIYNVSQWKNSLPVIRSSSGTLPFGWMTPTIFNTIINDSINDTYALHGHTFGFDLHRLTNMLGYNAQSLFANANLNIDATAWDGIVDDYSIRLMLRNVSSPTFCPYFYAAYQKIYMDVYRDTEFEHNNVKAYNMDSILNAGQVFFDPSSDWAYPGVYWGSNSTRLGMFELRYRNRNKDYFTAVHPNPLFNKLGFLPNVVLNSQYVKNWLSSGTPTISSDGLSVQNVASSHSVSATLSASTGSDLGRWINNSTGSAPGGGLNIRTNNPAGSSFTAEADTPYTVSHTHSLSGSATLLYSESDLNLASLRSNFAFEKLLRVMNNAGRHADDQLFALFGVKLPQGISNEVYRLKSFHTMVHLGEVVSTAQTQDSDGNITPLGEMAGRGSAVLNQKNGFEFTAPCPGIVMSIMSIVPRYKYVGAVEKDGFKVSLFDFFRPQTDNLGQQPMFNYELNYNFQTDTSTTRLGWQYAHMEDKCTFDKASLAFVTNGLNPWSFVNAAPYYKPGTTFGSMFKFNKVSPNALDSIFVAEYDGIKRYPNAPGDTAADGEWYTNFPTSYLRDPFKVDFHIDMLFTSSMSRFGEPSLGGI